MSTQVKLRKGTTTEHSSFTGVQAEVTVDTTKSTVVVHDGATAGGHPLLKESAIGTSVQAYDSNLTSFIGTFTLPTSDGSSGQVLKTDGSGNLSFSSGSGTVTSVGVTVPTGLSVSGSPITSSGTIAISLASGYSIPTNSSQTNWNTAYSWGNHASVGYLTSYTETDPVYTASSWYTTTNNSSNWNTAYSWGNHASAGYLTSSAIGSSVQGYDGDLAAIAAISATSGLLKKTSANTWTLDTNTYLTSYTETDPIFVASAAYNVTNTKISNWDSAYSWGNHASAGYLTSSAIGSTVQAYDADLASWAGKTAPTGAAVGTTDIQTLTNKTLTTPVITDPVITGTIQEDVYALTDASTVDIDPSNGSIQTLTLTSTGRTLTFTNMVAGEAITLMVNDGTAGTITTWNATFVNNSGTAPTLSTTGYTVVAIWKVSTTVYAAVVGNA